MIVVTCNVFLSNSDQTLSCKAFCYQPSTVFAYFHMPIFPFAALISALHLFFSSACSSWTASMSTTLGLAPSVAGDTRGRRETAKVLHLCWQWQELQEHEPLYLVVFVCARRGIILEPYTCYGLQHLRLFTICCYCQWQR